MRFLPLGADLRCADGPAPELEDDEGTAVLLDMSWPVAPTKAEAYGVLLFREPARSLLGPEWCSIVLVSELELKEYRLLGCDDASVGGVKPEVIVDQTKPLFV